jgi:hypothetical protein
VENSLVEKIGLLSLDEVDFIIIFIQLLYNYYTKPFNKINTNYNNEQQML